ncbi:unnamed protein product, partial [Rotaria magnacalcarata]
MPDAHTTTQRMLLSAHAKLVIPTLEKRRTLFAQTRAQSKMEVVIQMPDAHTTTQRMLLSAHAKLVIPTLEKRRTLFAQVR